MTDTPPTPAPEEIELPLLGLARVGLVLAGLGWLCMGPGLALTWGGPFFVAPLNPFWVDALGGGLVGLLALALCLILGVGSLALAWFVGQRQPESWWTGVVAGALLVPGACLPVGVLLLAALLSREARVAYQIAEPPP